MQRVQPEGTIVRSKRVSRPGQVMILFAAASLVLIGVVALAIDVGYLLAERRQNQAAVDSAALSAAVAVRDHRTSSEVQTSGKSYGHENADVPIADVNVEWPVAGTGPRTGDKYVKVTITKNVKKFFLGAIYQGDWQVSNTAIAGVETIPKPYALVALNCPGIAVNGGIQISIDGQGSAISNCNITNSGNSSIVTVGGSVDAVGTIQKNDGWTAPDGFNEGETASPDPLAGATAPQQGTSRTAPTSTCLGQQYCTIEPGYYFNQSFTIKYTVCMKPGTYYLAGTTKISFQDTGSTLTNQSTKCPGVTGIGGGVLIYIAKGSPTAGIQMGNGKLHISTSYPAIEPPPDPLPATGACAPAAAPYTGASCGMVLWIDNGSTFSTSGNADAILEGILYAPTSYVTLDGTPGSQGLQVVVGNLTLSGNSAFKINYRQYVRMDRPAIFLVE